MKLEEFAELSGLVLIRCSGEWGGTWGYYEVDTPNVQYCGYRSEGAVYKSWLMSKVGAAYPMFIKAIRKM